MSWRLKRQLTIVFLIFGFLLVTGGGIFWWRHPAPTCFDGRQNGQETGVDCGGSCALACLNEARPLNVLWARALPLGDDRYSLVALVENPNADLGLAKVKYEWRTFDGENLPLTVLRGETFVNPGERFALFGGLIKSPERAPKVARLGFSGAINWERTTSRPPLLRAEPGFFQLEPQPELQGELINLSLENLRDVQVVAVITDGEGNAVAGGATLVERLPANQSQEIIFSWPRPFASGASNFKYDLYPRVSVFGRER